MLARDPWVGERDPRSEDRQLFLDAICAAEDHLVITYTGADERTGAPVPPAVPLGELLDALDRTARCRADPAPACATPSPPTTRCSRSTRATSRRGASPAVVQLRPPVVRRCARGRAAAARAGAAVRRPAPCRGRPPTSTWPTCAGCSPTRRAASSGSGSAWPRPAARTSRPTRCRSSWTTSSSGPSASGCCTSGWPASTSPTASRSSGTAAPCRPDRSATRRCATSGPRSRPCCRPRPSSASTRPSRTTSTYLLADGTRLAGTVGRVRGDTLLSLTYSRLAARHRLLAWIDLVALTVAQPDREWRAVAVGRGKGSRAQRSVFDPLPPDRRGGRLDELVALYRAGLRSPLPLPVKTAAAYADRRNHSDAPTAREGAARDWVDRPVPRRAGGRRARPALRGERRR